ncbi:tbp-associated factor iif [Trichoderma arundinaceum]|uniref:Tbp-associated factor iif n=1 Tax=Trichoderma arundinaceum TaxID=490622 RepID=A0A395NV05_TRIAR|nr:tbp-associated factor iif [Trichoderma arundinaceum]
MASPPYATSPSAMSPPYPSPMQIPSKKRSSTIDMNMPPGKRRKSSVISQPPTHPLRQTSFPPEAGSPYPRSPSVDATSHVSGSVVSATTSGAPRKKRGRKAKNAKGDDSTEKTPSLVGGKALTTASGQGGDKELEDDEDDDKAEMALEDAVARTQEQKQEEIRLRAMLVEAFDPLQYDRYEFWRAAKLSDAVVKRVVNATVSQSVPQMVATAVKAVAKLFAGEIIEGARNVQAEWIVSGEKQSDLPTPPPSTEEAENEEEADLRRGPLRPDHLREAWRRYKLCHESRGETDSSAKSSAAAIRIRENQRRSRARRKEYVEGMQRKLQDFESKGVSATLEMQQAARDVAIENSRLRLLLAHNGITVDAVENFLQSFKGQDASEAEQYAAKIATAESIAALGRSSTVATLFPEHAHVDKLAVLASASMQQSASGHDSDGTITSDDSTTGPSTGPVTPNSSSMSAPSPSERDFEAPQAMSCDAAAQIIAQMQGCGLREPSKGSLENSSQNDYLIQNSAFLKILEAASIFN